MLLIIFNASFAFAQNVSKLFSEELMEYKGTKTEQALLLLRHVGLWGEIKEKEASIDTAFLDLLEKPIDFIRRR